MQLRGASDGRDDGSSEPVEATAKEVEEAGIAEDLECWRILSGIGRNVATISLRQFHEYGC